MTKEFLLFDGGSNPDLSASVARELGISLGACRTVRFPDGEISVQILQPVRCKDVFIIQPLCPPVNDHLVTLLAFADACRRAAAERITAIVPYLGYSRSDKRQARREPVGARMVADILQAVGIDHVVTMDLHSPQIEGFFHIPVDSLTAIPALSKALNGHLSPDAVIIAPDVGAVRRATEYAHQLNGPVVVLHKRRATGTNTEVTHIVGDVRGKSCLIVDDMISTGGTIAESIEALLAAGARPDITVAATHGVLLEGAREKLLHAAVRQVFVTDTVPVAFKSWDRLHIVSIAPVLAGAILRFVENGSISDLY